MNKIAAVESGTLNLIAVSKYFGIIVPADGSGVTVVPPLALYGYCGAGIAVYIEQALLPFKAVTAIGDGSGEIAAAARQAAKYFGGGSKYGAVLSALGDLIVALVAAEAGGASLSPAAEAVKAEILAHVSDASYSLEDGLKKLPLDYDYLRKLFKKELGLTPRGFLLRERMELARGLILGGVSNRYSPYSVSQIADLCGYSEPLYFSRVFKKYFGVAPSEYGKNK